MSTTKTLSFLEEMGWDRVEELAREASRKAIAEAHAHGLPVSVDVDGVPSLVYPDGRVEPRVPAPAPEAENSLTM